MQEIWKNIKGFEKYEVSTLGNIRNISTGIVLKPRKSLEGYLHVGLYVEGKMRMKKIHRLVAQEFIPNPENKPQVNHINEIKSDNRIENLEWLTAKENSNYGTRTKRMAESLSKPIIVIYRDKTYEEYPSITVAAQELGLCRKSINNVLTGRRNSLYGLKFEYIEGEEI